MENYDRRGFLSRLWRWTTGLVAAAGAWTTWDVLRAKDAGAGAVVRTVSPDEVPSVGVLEVREMRGYLTKENDEVVALWWKCTHLGCKVPWCESSGQFECPCHGSVYNRIGEYRRGPAPRGLDSYSISLESGEIVVDTGDVTLGLPPGNETLDEPTIGPECLGASE